MYANYEYKVIEDGQAYTDKAGNKYPANYPKDEIAELHKVVETPCTHDDMMIVEGFHIDAEFRQIWDMRAKTTEELANDVASKALAALAQSDLVAIRCLKAGVEFNSEWRAYVTALRAVVGGQANVLPVQPQYPQGS